MRNEGSQHKWLVETLVHQTIVYLNK